MSYVFSDRSERNLRGVHPALVDVVRRALEISPTDFAVIEGLRTLVRQRELVAKGASQTLASRHLTGHAVDLVPIIGGAISFAWPPFYPLAEAVKRAAAELGTQVEWGGDWPNFRDGPHWQIDPKRYPMPKATA